MPTASKQIIDLLGPDAEKLLRELLAVPSQPRILLCLPTANFADLPGMPEARKASVAGDDCK